jgi:hypothetical protein
VVETARESRGGGRGLAWRDELSSDRVGVAAKQRQETQRREKTGVRAVSLCGYRIRDEGYGVERGKGVHVGCGMWISVVDCVRGCAGRWRSRHSEMRFLWGNNSSNVGG